LVSISCLLSCLRSSVTGMISSSFIQGTPPGQYVNHDLHRGTRPVDIERGAV
jgi:hypothetical protein